MPRRWWAYPDTVTGAVVPSAEQAKQIIEKQIAAAEDYIATLRKRLGEVESDEKTK